ncbi:MAG: hypothetical protein JWO59_710 [Chloroflexi bacterium]|nr:hypothetical protein [Chloroflexota bacterium]
MAEMELTVDQVAEALGVQPFTVKRWIRAKRFPRAYLLHGSKKFGYRIPLGDVVAYAATQSELMVEQVHSIADSARIANTA